LGINKIILNKLNPIFNRWGFLFIDIFITKEYIMKRIVRLTESELTHIIKRIINEGDFSPNVIKYGKGMRGKLDTFTNKMVPESKFSEDETVMVNRYGKEGTITSVVVDNVTNEISYQVDVEMPNGRTYNINFTDEELS
jgi:hypothetical protein